MEINTVTEAANLLSAALKLYKTLNCNFSSFGCKSDLEKLQRVVFQVKAALLDRETKQKLNRQEIICVEGLTRVVYDAEDLLDMYRTHCRQQQLNGDCQIVKKVRQFFSPNNPIKAAHTLSLEADIIANKLAAMNEISIERHSLLPASRREEPDYYVPKDEIIGREDEVEQIVGHLLNESDAPEDVSFLCIVGMGGLGKTALAQLVFRDPRVNEAFPNKIWTSISDHDQQSLDLEPILNKILCSRKIEKSNLGLLKKNVTEKFSSNKLLLVLDDVWTEDRINWLKLGELLSEGRKGSWIVVTTRSYMTAKIISHLSIKYSLKGLSKEDSWRLFEKKAFGSKSGDIEFIKIGQEIVEGCAGVPLAISVAGSLFYGLKLDQWESFKKRLTRRIGQEGSIISILKFSYDQLELPLKSCFTYCALFPKDYFIKKEMIIRVWMAQGYIDPLNNDQTTLEDVAEKYLSTLLYRCFFQDVTLDWSGKIISFKLHDLMHDLAVAEAGNKICVTVFPSKAFDPNVRHLAYTSGEFARHSFTETHIRSYCYVGPSDDKPRMDESDLKALLSNWKRLRALDFHNVRISSLPESIGGLMHLRYLDLLNKNSELEVLPNSISELFNLQTLIIGGCQKLKELPPDFSKLANLRMLKITYCGIEYVTCLGAFPHLNTLTLEWLSELKYLIALPAGGRLHEKENLCCRPSLRTLTHNMIGWSCLTVREDNLCTEETLCCPSLEKLELWGLPKLKGWSYFRAGEGDSSSSSGNMATLLLPQLKLIQISECNEMKLNMLCPSLEDIQLDDINEGLQINDRDSMNEEKGKGMESGSSNTILSSALPSTSDGIPKLRSVVTDNVRWLNRMPMKSFQYLKMLQIDTDNKVKSLGEAREVFLACKFSLESLVIKCYALTSVMSGGLVHLTALKTLTFEQCSKLSFSEEEEKERMGGIGNDDLNLHQTLCHLKFFNLSKLKFLPDWMQFLQKLETLEILKCKGIEAIPYWMPKLTSLTKLRIEGCSKQLKERCENSDAEDWPLIQHIPSISISDQVYRESRNT